MKGINPKNVTSGIGIGLFGDESEASFFDSIRKSIFGQIMPGDTGKEGAANQIVKSLAKRFSIESMDHNKIATWFAKFTNPTFKRESKEFDLKKSLADSFPISGYSFARTAKGKFSIETKPKEGMKTKDTTNGGRA